jgi:hypothetical protein
MGCARSILCPQLVRRRYWRILGPLASRMTAAARAVVAAPVTVVQAETTPAADRDRVAPEVTTPVAATRDRVVIVEAAVQARTIPAADRDRVAPEVTTRVAETPAVARAAATATMAMAKTMITTMIAIPARAAVAMERTTTAITRIRAVVITCLDPAVKTAVRTDTRTKTADQ